MLIELYGKGGRVCEPAREGRLRCPLIVRPTSEDVVTGHLCTAMRALNPRWWLPDLLNTALGAQRFRRQVFRRLEIEPWQNQRPFPRELLPWNEGSTQVDLTIRWENPPTTVFIEMKYLAQPSTSVAGDNGDYGFPSDQIIRNIRVGLLEAGQFNERRMFHQHRRDFVFLLMAVTPGERLIHRYRSHQQLMRSIPHSDQLVRLPQAPFVGELTYSQLCRILRGHVKRFTRPERKVTEMLVDYLSWKHEKSVVSGRQQQTLPGLEKPREEFKFENSEIKS